MAKKKTKKLAISTKKTLVLSFSIIAVCVAMLGVSIALSYKDVLKNNIAQKKESAENISREKDVVKKQDSILEEKEKSTIVISKDFSEREESETGVKTTSSPVVQKDTTASNAKTVAKTSATTTKSQTSTSSKTTSSATTSSATTSSGTASSGTTSSNVSKKQTSQIASGKGEKDDEPEVKPAEPGSKGTVIIIFDDAGHNLSHLQPYLEIPFPVTISVLPKLAHSKEAAHRARLAGKEVMLHQPMQAKNLKLSPGPGAIVPTDDMDEWKIKNIVLENLSEVGKVSGINNHEGSLITENAWASGLVLDVCRDKGLFFLDSRTTSESAVPIAAAERGMKIYERDIFIDNTNSHSDMLKEIEKGLKIAQKKGYVIMIGHIRPHGLAKLLTQNYSKWKNDGYEFSTITKSAGKIK